MRLRAPPLLLAACTLADTVHRDPHGRYSIAAPSAWTAVEEQRQLVFSRASEPEVTVSVAIAPRREEGRRQDRTLAVVADAARTMLRGFGGGTGTIVADRATTAAGRPARLLEATFEHRNRVYRRRQIVIEAPHDAVFVGLTAPQPQFAAGAIVFDAMLGTLELEGTP